MQRESTETAGRPTLPGPCPPVQHGRSPPDRLGLGRPALRTRSEGSINLLLLPLLKSGWVEMRDPAPPRRRTHGGTGAPATIATGRTDGLRFKTMSCASSVSAGTTSPIRNSKEPFFLMVNEVVARMSRLNSRREDVLARTFRKAHSIRGVLPRAKLPARLVEHESV